jgi:hypothetical protein
MFVHLIFNDACKMAVNFFSIALPYKLIPGCRKNIISIKCIVNQARMGMQPDAA